VLGAFEEGHIPETWEFEAIHRIYKDSGVECYGMGRRVIGRTSFLLASLSCFIKSDAGASNQDQLWLFIACVQ